jgi:hypothetical protein
MLLGVGSMVVVQVVEALGPVRETDSLAELSV